MFKILVLCVVYAALSQARPHASYLPSYSSYEYEPTVVGYESLAVPAAVSHQSSTVVHEKRPYLRPIVEHHAPLLSSYSALPAYSSLLGSSATYSSLHGSLHGATPYAYSSSPLGYANEWYEPGWNNAVSSYPSIYLKR